MGTVQINNLRYFIFRQSGGRCDVLILAGGFGMLMQMLMGQEADFAGASARLAVKPCNYSAPVLLLPAFGGRLGWGLVQDSPKIEIHPTLPGPATNRLTFSGQSPRPHPNPSGGRSKADAGTETIRGAE